MTDGRSVFQSSFSARTERRRAHFRAIAVNRCAPQRVTLAVMTAVRMLLLLFVGPVVVAAPGAIPAHETLDYSIEWRLVTAGKAHLVWGASPRHANSADPGWQADLHLESTGLVS